MQRESQVAQKYLIQAPAEKLAVYHQDNFISLIYFISNQNLQSYELIC
jgi:K+-transporting ATPase A subunit